MLGQGIEDTREFEEDEGKGRNTANAKKSN